MGLLTSLILTLAIILGQFIKLPLPGQGGVTMLDIAVIFLALIGLLKLKFKLKKPPLFLTAAFIFIAVAALSLIFTPLDLQASQYLASFLYTLRLSAYFLFGWLIFSGAYPAFKQKIPLVLLSSGTILAVLGLLQLIFIPDLRFLTKDGWDPHYFRTVSTFLDPNFLGGYFALTLILLASRFGTNLNKIPKMLYLIFPVIYLALLTTFSRGSYLAFFIGFLTLSLLNKSVKLGLVSVILSAGLLYGYYNYQQSVAAPRNINRTQSAQLRINTWQQGLSLFQQNPVLGSGYNTYRYALKQYHLANEDFLETHGASTNDSSLLFVAATTGTVGLTAYLFFLGNLLETAWQKYLQKKSLAKVCIAGVLAVLTQSFFANTLFYPFILIWIVLISASISE